MSDSDPQRLKAPAFQFYPKDWLDHKVTRMSYEAQGVYMRLLCLMWIGSDDQCSIVDDARDIARSLGISTRKWQSLRSVLQKSGVKLFSETCANDETPARLVSERLKREVHKQQEFRAKKSRAGTLGARARWDSSANGGAIRLPMANDSSSSASSTAVTPLPPKTEKWQSLLQEAIAWFHGPMPKRREENHMIEVLKGFGEDQVRYALDECKKGDGVKALRYFETILGEHFHESQKSGPEKPTYWRSDQPEKGDNDE